MGKRRSKEQGCPKGSRRTRKAGDLAVELRTLQEISKLSNVYAAPTLFDADESAESPADALARQHLEGLGITPKNLPIEELARQVAAIWLNQMRSQNNAIKK